MFFALKLFSWFRKFLSKRDKSEKLQFQMFTCFVCDKNKITTVLVSLLFLWSFSTFNIFTQVLYNDILTLLFVIPVEISIASVKMTQSKLYFKTFKRPMWIFLLSYQIIGSKNKNNHSYVCQINNKFHISRVKLASAIYNNYNSLRFWFFVNCCLGSAFNNSYLRDVKRDNHLIILFLTNLNNLQTHKILIGLSKIFF